MLEFGERTPRKAGNLNITPLIDIVFLLVIFFMITSSFIKMESLDLRLPAGGAMAIPDTGVQIITMASPQDIRINNKPVAVDNLRTTLQALAKENPDRPFILEGTARINVQQMMDVLDMLYQEGARNVSLTSVGMDAIPYRDSLPDKNTTTTPTEGGLTPIPLWE